MSDPRWLYIAAVVLSMPAIVGLPPLADEPMMTGKATWYDLPGTMRDGTRYDPQEETCAVDDGLFAQFVTKPVLICTIYNETKLKLSDLELTESGRCVKCSVTDSGYLAQYGIVVDMSRAAFRRLAPLGVGVVNVDVWRLE